MAIEDFLYNLILNTDVFLDLYIELPPYIGEKYISSKFEGYDNTRLQKMFDTFVKCIQYATRGAEECRLARVHYFDTRMREIKDVGFEFTSFINWYRRKLVDISKTHPKSEWAEKFRSFNKTNKINVDRIMERFSEKDDEKFLDFWMEEVINNKLNYKEFGKINKIDKVLFEKIFIFIRTEFIEETKKYRKSWQENARIILNQDKYKDSALISALSIMCNTIFLPLVLVADAYLLCRVFKIFDMSEMEKKAYSGATDQPIRAHNIIIYAGETHSEIYRKFLEQNTFKEIAKAGNIQNEIITCLDMKTIREPFFSYLPAKKI